MQPFECTPEDLKQLEERGISRSTFTLQLKHFERGFPYLDVVAAADDTNGIKSLTPEELSRYICLWDKTLADPTADVLKFVPASGAASRMFKELYQYLSESGEEEGAEIPPLTKSVETFLSGLQTFAFEDELNRACLLNHYKSTSKLYQQGEYPTIIRALLDRTGMSYGSLPKALLLFHRYAEGPRTAAEEHLAEGALYAKNGSGKVRVHFTLSPEHIAPFEKLMKRKIPMLKDHFSVEYEVTYSIQKPETDTVAVDTNNQPIRDAEGRLVFRPGGHGALIENLNDLSADFIFIKNIDNVVPDRYKSDTVIYKKALGGYLVHLREKVYNYTKELAPYRKLSPARLDEMKDFLQEAFRIDTSYMERTSGIDAVEELRRHFNRPIRVCGMVRNEGEPGGGPYIVRSANGATSLQILESSQINKNDPEATKIFESSRFFNPVDLVCCVKDYKGQKYNLKAFVDEETGFISHKSKDGRELKALELPGLWNGAMAGWNTAFVEVPGTTFNPVKEVNDLLRPTHI